jgi:hypothetical protein
MQAVYLLLFGLFAGLAGLLEYSDAGWLGLGLRSAGGGQRSSGGTQHQGPGASLKPEYLRFRNNYVTVFSLMMGG